MSKLWLGSSCSVPLIDKEVMVMVVESSGCQFLLWLQRGHCCCRHLCLQCVVSLAFGSSCEAVDALASLHVCYCCFFSAEVHTAALGVVGISVNGIGVMTVTVVW